jgi:hypothetical protein
MTVVLKIAQRIRYGFSEPSKANREIRSDHGPHHIPVAEYRNPSHEIYFPTATPSPK